jgi:hypothetical protein
MLSQILTIAASAFCLGTCLSSLATNPLKEFSGKYKHPKISIEITSASDDIFKGNIRLGQELYPVTAHQQGDSLKGNFQSHGDSFSFTAQLEGNEMLLVTGGTSYTLQRETASPNPLVIANQPVNPLADSTSPTPQATPSSRTVTINSKKISDQDLSAFEQTYRLRIKDGDYWYDKRTGAWGYTGGPCVGFIMANLDVGASLRENASNGDTGVVVNGRELHRLDVWRLKQVTPVWPGRYWMDAQGSFGYEGGPMLGNIWLAAARAAWGSTATSGGGGGGSVKREGILSTYDKCGAVVIGN